MNTRRQNIRGSILMETALVIPLYLAFLSGVFWVGDLALLRSKSAFFDRFAAWGDGRRRCFLSAEASRKFLTQTFLNPEKAGKQQVDSVRLAPPPRPDASSAWLFIAGAAVQVSVEPPVWTQAWRRSALLMTRQQAPELRRTAFRSRETGGAFTHRTIMRVKSDFREKATPQALAEKPDWLRKVYYASWPDTWTEEKTIQISGASPCPKYERHDAFVRWSE